jgi:hypothetical protein
MEAYKLKKLFEVLLVVLFFYSSSLSFSGTSQLTHELSKEEKTKILTLVKKYGESIGCGFVMSADNIQPYVSHNKNQYIALFSLDVGCSGGTGMSQTVIAVIDSGANAALTINLDYSLPQYVSSTVPPRLNKIVWDGEKVLYEGLDYNWLTRGIAAEFDAICCPSMLVKGYLVFENGWWVAQPIQ